MSLKRKGRKSILKKLFSTRQHPIRILGYTTRSFWLLLIPLTRDLIASRYDIASWLRGSWLSILTIIVIFGYAFLRWFAISYRLEEDCIIAKSGYFGLLESKIYFDKVTSISVSQGPVYRLFRAHKVYINTNSGLLKGDDLALTMKSSDYRRLIKLLSADDNAPADMGGRFSYKPKRSQLLVFSLVFSSSLSGLLIVVTFLLQGSRMVGEKLQERLALGLYDITKQVEQLISNIPPIAAAAAIIISAGWMISFIANLLRHWSFRCVRKGEKIIIQSGFIAKRFHVLERKSIVCVDLQQSLLMKPFRICSVRIQCHGYGAKNREINVLIPIATGKEVACSLKLLVPEFPLPSRSVRPRLRDMMFYVIVPLIFCIAYPTAGFVAKRLIPSWSDAVSFAMLMLEVPSAWLMVVKLVSGFTTGAGFQDGYLRLDYCRWYAFHTTIIPTASVSKLSTRQTWSQFLKNRCNIQVRVAALSSKTYMVKNLKSDDVNALFDKSGIELLSGHV